MARILFIRTADGGRWLVDDHVRMSAPPLDGGGSSD
jgi:hypothetical protein